MTGDAEGLDLQILKAHRQSLWHAELAGWLHNIGKMTKAFRGYQASNGKTAYRHEYVTGFLAAKTPRNGPSVFSEQVRSLAVSSTQAFQKESNTDCLREIFDLPILLPGWSDGMTVGSLIDLQAGNEKLIAEILPAEGQHWLPILLSRAHQQASGQDKTAEELERLKSDPAERGQELSEPLKKLQNSLERAAYRDGQTGEMWAISSAFGFESDFLENQYPQAISAAADLLQETQRKLGEDPTLSKCSVRDRLFQILCIAQADSRRPVHDSRVGDMGKMAAAFFKSQIARVLLAGTREYYQWRLVRISADGPAFAAQGVRISDTLARRAQFEAELDRVRRAIEDESMLGNEVYRDEYGAVYVLGSFDDAAADSVLEALLDRVLPLPLAEIHFRRQIGPPFAMHQYGEYSFCLPPLLDADVKWTHSPNLSLSEFGWEKENQQVCSICRLRPVPFRRDHPHAFAQGICMYCFKIRVGRSGRWLDKPETTIWLDEVGDRNGRFALIVARLRLDRWLTESGYIDQSLAMAEVKQVGYSKGASAARLSRVWETSRDLWRVWRDSIAPSLSQRGRWRLSGSFSSSGYLQEPKRRRAGQSYTLIPKDYFRGTKLSVVLTGNDLSEFVVTDNLERIQRQVESGLSFEEALVGLGLTCQVEEPTGYGSHDNLLGEFSIEQAVFAGPAFARMIPLLEDPQMMMTIVPADQAFSCAKALRNLYEERMNKVQDRLGLDLGIVYAPLEIPIPAVMDAGRRILRRKLEAREATVQEVATDGHRTTIIFESGRRCVYDWGTKDPKKADVWFPNLLPVGGAPNTVQRCHVSEIQKGDRVWLEPSTFDFQFLESASRRFDLFYDLAGDKRRSSDWKHRPYRLDELDLFDSTLTILTRSLGLGKSDAKKHQIKALDGILEQKRQTWGKGWGDLDVAFIHWALRNVEWTAAPSSEEFTTLVAAIQRGVFADLIEILVGVEKSARLGAETESMVHD